MGRWLVFLALSGCLSFSGPYNAPVVAATDLGDNYAVMVCSWNNLPLIKVWPQVLASNDVEILLAHERQHSDDAYAYRGGCWPWMYRFQKDTVFQKRAQLRAYCTQGRAAIERNRNPEQVWSYIKAVMLEVYGDTLTKFQNCLYEER